MKLAFIFKFLILTSCLPSMIRASDPDFAPADIKFFEKRIRPLLVSHCYECHSAEAKQLQAGLRMDSREAMLRGGDAGPAIVPGKPDASLLIEAVYYDGELEMPPKGKLPSDEIALLERWVRVGAPMPKQATTEAPRNVEIDYEKARHFWSFLPLMHHNLPVVQRSDWPEQRLDYFVLARLDEQSLQPSSRADRRTLIRRAAFDLTGLPPTPKQIREFEQDDTPDAYARLIDRLLASPHYGERWGRYWLDLARYTDTTANWLNSTGHAYLYRDWIIQALNDDLPYDQFVKYQLAADMIPDAHPKDTAALGFVGLSPTYWKELKLAQDVIKTVVAEEWEERIDALGRTFLGLTLACARCHDHKFDPVSQHDYYALAGVFASTRFADRPIISAEQLRVVQEAKAQVKSLEEQLIKVKKEQTSNVEEQAKVIASIETEITRIKATTFNYDSPMAHAVEDAALYVLADGPDKTKLEYKPGQPRDVSIHIRGNPAKPGEVAKRQFLKVFSSSEPKPFTHGSGRLELAEAIISDAGSLAARVIVNRVWHHHYGRGLVATPSNFGAQGSRPTHPKLLDDLAARFVDQAWSLKWLHREIMLSATYQQSAAFSNANQRLDPNNHFLWRMNRRRLDIEAWRDAMLDVCGAMDRRVGGPPAELNAADNRLRTVYGLVHRRDLNYMLRLHDFADPTGHSPKRDETITPLQQLFVLNSDFMRNRAAELSSRLAEENGNSIEDRISRAYELLFGRTPSSMQMAAAVDYLTSQSIVMVVSDEAWRNYLQVLLGSNEFLFMD